MDEQNLLRYVDEFLVANYGKSYDFLPMTEKEFRALDNFDGWDFRITCPGEPIQEGPWVTVHQKDHHVHGTPYIEAEHPDVPLFGYGTWDGETFYYFRLKEKE